mgnify:CR=1 FL=1
MRRIDCGEIKLGLARYFPDFVKTRPQIGGIVASTETMPQRAVEQKDEADETAVAQIRGGTQRRGASGAALSPGGSSGPSPRAAFRVVAKPKDGVI